MARCVNSSFEEGAEQLFDLAEVVERISAAAGLDYRIVGGLAVCLNVEEAAPDAGRLTKDIDIVVRREDLERIAQTAGFGLQYRHATGADRLIRAGEPGRRAVHLVFACEKVRREYPDAVPALGVAREARGLRLIPLVDLVRMKLTSFRLKDQTHLKDLEEAGLITPGLEAEFSGVLAERLARIKASEQATSSRSVAGGPIRKVRSAGASVARSATSRKKAGPAAVPTMSSASWRRRTMALWMRRAKSRTGVRPPRERIDSGSDSATP
jgi:hypothetical protein